MRLWYHHILETQRSVAEVVGSPVRIGRHADNDIVLANPFVSDFAVVLEKSNDHWELTSLGANGLQGRRRAVAAGRPCGPFGFEPCHGVPFPTCVGPFRRGHGDHEAGRCLSQRRIVASREGRSRATSRPDGRRYPADSGRGKWRRGPHPRAEHRRNRAAGRNQRSRTVGPAHPHCRLLCSGGNDRAVDRRPGVAANFRQRLRSPFRATPFRASPVGRAVEPAGDDEPGAGA